MNDFRDTFVHFARMVFTSLALIAVCFAFNILIFGA